jgi:hypothetical protein
VHSCAVPIPATSALLSGRFFDEQDRLGHADKVIISRELVRRYFHGESPLGQHIAVPLWNDAEYEVVGVVGDTIHRVGQPTMATFYLPAFTASISRAEYPRSTPSLIRSPCPSPYRNNSRRSIRSCPSPMF